MILTCAYHDQISLGFLKQEETFEHEKRHKELYKQIELEEQLTQIKAVTAIWRLK